MSIKINALSSHQILKGSLRIAASKSHTMRALLFASLAEGQSKIYHPLSSPDTDAMVAACQDFGARMNTQDPKKIIIQGTAATLKQSTHMINAHNSGQVLRFIAALAALSPFHRVITGDASTKTRR